MGLAILKLPRIKTHSILYSFKRTVSLPGSSLLNPALFQLTTNWRPFISKKT